MNVGDFVRTKYGITQYKEYETTNGDKILCMPVKDGSQGIFANVEDIIKSSPNIIDLIEVGDYVNGHKVLDIAQAPIRVLYLEDISQTGALIPVCDYQIESIVTKEQFSQMEYKINE